MRYFYSLFLSLSLIGLVRPGNAEAQVAKEFAVDLSAQVSGSQITISWKAIDAASLYTVRRREYGETTWGSETIIEPPVTKFVDTKVAEGKIYEYRVGALTSKTTYGFIASGINVPAPASEGTLLLLVGSTAAQTCAAGLERYIDDLVRVGWNVEMQVVSETATPQEIKAKILQANEKTETLRALFLFGHVPIPYSGNLAPDGHKEDHLGAWPADGYYGELDGDWTDESVNSTSAVRPQNKNIPGDGKFDQSSFPSAIELEVGRVDMRNMGWFYIDAPNQAQREALLLNNYLEKNHKFRLAQLPHNSKAVVSDVVGQLGPTDVPAAIAWRAFPILTDDVQPTTTWMDKLSAEPHHWAYGAGFGNYFVAEGVGTTEEYSKRDPKAIFTMLFGSRFGDWDSDDNLLRAPLGTSTGLASMWAGRPYWYVHQMAMGKTIGEATRHSQSASASYITTFNEGNVEMALMGDPTLRNIEIPVQLTGLKVSAPKEITWNSAGPNVTDYHVARGPSRKGPFTPVMTTTITGTSFFDASADPSKPFYLVRPVLEGPSPSSGIYFQSGRGEIVNIFASVQEPAKPGATMKLSGNTISFEFGGNASLTIIDVLGRTVVERRISAYDNFEISPLISGAYIAQLRTSNGIETLRFNR
jgi:hypothetical protein